MINWIQKVSCIFICPSRKGMSLWSIGGKCVIYLKLLDYRASVSFSLAGSQNTLWSYIWKWPLLYHVVLFLSLLENSSCYSIFFPLFISFAKAATLFLGKHRFSWSQWLPANIQCGIWGMQQWLGRTETAKPCHWWSIKRQHTDKRKHEISSNALIPLHPCEPYLLC